MSGNSLLSSSLVDFDLRGMASTTFSLYSFLESDRGAGSTFSDSVLLDLRVSLEGVLVSLAGETVSLVGAAVSFAGDEALAEFVTLRGVELFEVDLAGAVVFGVASVAFSAESVVLVDVVVFVELADPVELALVSFLSPFIALSNSYLEELLAVELSEDSSSGFVTLTEDPSVAFAAVEFAETFEESLVTLGLLKLIDLFDTTVAFSEGVTLAGLAVELALVAFAAVLAFV